MPLNLASPGIVIREVDLTIGRVDPTSGSIGALVAPFAKGPVNDPQLIESEEDLLQTFGQPYSTDKHYEYWMVASSYLAYGGTMQVVRAGDTGLKNAFSGIATTGLVIKSNTHYNQCESSCSTIFIQRYSIAVVPYHEQLVQARTASFIYTCERSTSYDYSDSRSLSNHPLKCYFYGLSIAG